MHTCPHCMNATISNFDKWLSDRITPTTCSVCGGLSYVSHQSIAFAKLGAIAIGLVGAWLAAYFMNFYLVVTTAILAAVWFMRFWYIAPLKNTDINTVSDQLAHYAVALHISVIAGVIWVVYYYVL